MASMMIYKSINFCFILNFKQKKNIIFLFERKTVNLCRFWPFNALYDTRFLNT